MATSKVEQVVEFVRQRGVVRSRDIERIGVSREYLRRLTMNGVVVRVGRGLYTLPNAEPSAHRSLVEAARLVPHGVVCLLSALQFHQLTTQLPREVWLAVDRRAWKPVSGGPPLRVVKFSGDALTEGVEQHRIEGTVVPIYCPAKTVADCFKYRNKIGLDVALEALRYCWRERRCSMDDLWHYAKVCRVANVMRPYLESLI